MANVNYQKLILEIVEWAVAQNADDPYVPLNGIRDAIMQNGFQEGRFLVSVNEAGGTVQFAAFEGYDGPAILSLIHEAKEWMNQQPDITNLRTRGRILKRARVSFRKTSFSQNAFCDY